MKSIDKVIVIVPAAGVGKRMQANCPKQYLTINGESVLTHTLTRLLSHPLIAKVVLALGADDQYFSDTSIATHPDIIRVIGGNERVDSVLNGLKEVNNKEFPWVLVHDAARPCVTHHDISQLISQCLENDCGGILATPVRDTMKRGLVQSDNHRIISNTVEREELWHALTPQMYKSEELTHAIEQGLSEARKITDEASAIELQGLPSLLVPASSDNIKITHPDDLALAEFYLTKQANN